MIHTMIVTIESHDTDTKDVYRRVAKSLQTSSTFGIHLGRTMEAGEGILMLPVSSPSSK